MPYSNEWWEDNAEQIDRACRAGFLHEVECYGICDGVDRLPLDPSYIQYPEYRRGHATGLKMEASKEAVASRRE
ncbi:MAG: hypothetical protein DDT25_00867 [Chloroflexi bacterium]|nr:hypothetical protein [Chloroflexota bacterium]